MWTQGAGGTGLPNSPGLADSVHLPFLCPPQPRGSHQWRTPVAAWKPVLAERYDWRCARNWGAPWPFWCVRGYEEVFEVEGIRLVRTEVPLRALRWSRLVWGVRSLWRRLVLLPSWAAWWAYRAHYWRLYRTLGSFLKTKYSVCAYVIEIKLPALPLLKFIYAKNVGTSVAGHGSNL